MRRWTVGVPMDWLLEGEPWIVYRTRRDLLGQPDEDPSVRAARAAMLASAPVRSLVADLSGWPGKVVASHKSASQPFHKLTFVADLGLMAFFFFYTMAFTWAFDRVFGLPASAAG